MKGAKAFYLCYRTSEEKDGKFVDKIKKEELVSALKEEAETEAQKLREEIRNYDKRAYDFSLVEQIVVIEYSSRGEG